MFKGLGQEKVIMSMGSVVAERSIAAKGYSLGRKKKANKT